MFQNGGPVSEGRFFFGNISYARSLSLMDWGKVASNRKRKHATKGKKMKTTKSTLAVGLAIVCLALLGGWVATRSNAAAASASNPKWTLTVSPSTETVPAGSNCKFSAAPTGPNNFTGVRVTISSDISPKTSQTPVLRQPTYDTSINSGSVGIYGTTGKGSKGTYTITATARGIQYPIVGQTTTASATLIVE